MSYMRQNNFWDVFWHLFVQLYKDLKTWMFVFPFPRETSEVSGPKTLLNPKLKLLEIPLPDFL